MGMLDLGGILDWRPEHNLQHRRSGDGGHGLNQQVLHRRVGTVTNERFAEGDLNLFAKLIQAVSASLEGSRRSPPFGEDVRRNSIVGMGVRAEIVRAIFFFLRIHTSILLERSHSVGTKAQWNGRNGGTSQKRDWVIGEGRAESRYSNSTGSRARSSGREEFQSCVMAVHGSGIGLRHLIRRLSAGGKENLLITRKGRFGTADLVVQDPVVRQLLIFSSSVLVMTAKLSSSE